MREFVDACRAEGLRVGLHLSPWDRNAPVYGDSPRYNDGDAAQLAELLTRYGDIHEVWFDGANGEGPDGKRQEYDWPRVWGLVPVPGMSGDEAIGSLTQGDRDGTVWRPVETDTSIRPGWFYHPAEDTRVTSVDDLVEILFTSVGRNSKLLLNMPPTRAELLHETDIARLIRMRARLDAIFAEDLR